MRSLLIFLADPVRTFYEKGELKKDYYNPGGLFSEVTIVSFAQKDMEPETVSFIAGDALLRIVPVGSFRGLSSLGIIPRILNLIRKVRPDAIRSYDPSLRGLIAVICGKICRIPVVISLHCSLDEQRLHNSNPLFKIRKIFERFSIGSAEKIICVTEHVAEYAKRYGARDTVVIYNRIDLAQFDPKNRKVRPGLILSVGRLDPQKYQECLIRALKGMNHARLILIGSGPQERMLKRMVFDMALAGRVDFIKSVPHGEIHKYYAMAELFAIATHYEGFCIPVLEAMASGVPVVASDIAPIREIGGGAVKLVRNDPESFRNAFIDIMKDEDRKERMSLNGLACARERFDYKRLEESERAAYLALRRYKR